MAKSGLQRVEPVHPESLVEAQPLLHGGEGSGLQPADMGTSAHLPADKAGPLQDADMLGGGGEGHGEGRRQFADVPFACGKILDHRAPCRIGKGVEDAIQ